MALSPAGILAGLARLQIGGSRQGGEIRSGPGKGRKGPQRPDWSATFNLNYRRELRGGWTGFLNLRGNSR